MPHTQYSPPNTKSFSGKSTFEPGLLCLRERTLFFELVCVAMCLPNPYTRMGVLTMGSFSLFCKIVKTTRTYKSDLGFLGFL